MLNPPDPSFISTVEDRANAQAANKVRVRAGADRIHDAAQPACDPDTDRAHAP
jgi:hypothetical protein